MATSTGTISTSAGPLDVSTLVNQLIAVESKSKLTPLKTKESGFNTLISAYGSLKNALTSYQSALKVMTAASFSAQKTTVSNAGTGTSLTTDPFTAEANSDDSTKVLAQKLKSGGYASGATFNAGDSIAIKIGTNSPTFITLQANATLAGVRDTINASKAGVTASIVTDGSGDHLVLESNTGGTANTIKVTANNSLSGLSYDPSVSGSVTQIQAPRDATKAAAGKYSIGVSQLAQAVKVSSAGIVPGTTFDNGVLAIKTGNGSTTLIQPKTNTLAGVRDAINASDAGVNAAIVSDGTNDHLVLTAKDSGAANSLRVSGTGNFAVFNFDPSGTVTTTGVATNQTYSSGSLALQVGSKSFTITPTDLDNSGAIGLNDVMKAINDANTGVTASISNDGSNDHLVLTPAGTDPIKLVGSNDYANLSGSSMGQLAKAQDAKLTIDGVAVTSTTNKVSNAISGVTLNLAKVTTAADNFSLSIANDTSGLSTAANSFVTAYNNLAKAVTNLTKQTPSTTKGQASTGSPLAAESSVLNMMTQIRGTMLGALGDDGGMNLSQVGISFQKDGTLALDATKLTTAGNKDFDAVAKLFTGTSGVVPKLQKLMDSILGDSGTLATKTKGLQDSLKIVTDQQTAANDRLQTLKDNYTNQFNRLNVTLATMQSRQSYLTQQLAKLSKSS
ncbi:flagellar filament capping protein FliD [Herbaspirillum sp.]|jgi:flagellar hook-associated protein 2|uniref:flagellar filament capping protein FliD n=1 Tax=Herbaspirillum TaxID=963 RepID=UPI00258AAFD3|nr:flagellar filament capping protein FliD [Herbaspirillum sp.]MCP3656045.1 flagellar filament capping protein FliD [Herbaspirillum sp.]MCP3948232.1 flagellar filament capping protein FliD [Herbaspirillum sp.]MCP4030873.1 flagellar filament capping protein FliD [Herbaspirillum sp.]MCP4557710.1 flagellar filament capping protein FliD [Herbaspirillum sp.]